MSKKQTTSGVLQWRKCKRCGREALEWGHWRGRLVCIACLNALRSAEVLNALDD